MDRINRIDRKNNIILAILLILSEYITV